MSEPTICRGKRKFNREGRLFRNGGGPGGNEDIPSSIRRFEWEDVISRVRLTLLWAMALGHARLENIADTSSRGCAASHALYSMQCILFILYKELIAIVWDAMCSAYDR